MELTFEDALRVARGSIEMTTNTKHTDERAEFQSAFDKLGYLWSENNQEKAFLGWRLAKEAALQQVEPQAHVGEKR